MPTYEPAPGVRLSDFQGIPFFVPPSNSSLSSASVTSLPSNNPLVPPGMYNTPVPPPLNPAPASMQHMDYPPPPSSSSNYPPQGSHGQSGYGIPGMPQPGMPMPPQPGMPQPGMPQPGMPQPGMNPPGFYPPPYY
eukprot:Awhi_evm1s12979